MNSYSTPRSVDLMVQLVHDLRQPLTNIGLTASYLDLVLETRGGCQTKEHLRAIQEQVERASGMLDEASTELRRLRDHEPADVEAPKVSAASI